MTVSKLLVLFLVLFLCLNVVFSADKLRFKEDGTFKIVHLSDVHYRIHPTPDCRDVSTDIPYTCDGNTNTTDFIQRVIDLERPDIIIHTGDVIDGNTHTAAEGMDALYGVSIANNLPWAASLGNHDDDSDETRPQVMQHIVNMENTLSTMNSLGDSYGNFYLEIYGNKEDTPMFRTWHFDSDTKNASINTQQVEWYTSTESTLITVNSLAFFHVPTKEYLTALFHKDSQVCGGIMEHPSFSKSDNNIVDAFSSNIKATFAGHDHTNDYCVYMPRDAAEGIQLCYEGSPGYQGYGKCNARGNNCVKRRTRVTEITKFGQQINSWKRLDDYAETGSASVIDRQVLWSKDVIEVEYNPGNCELKSPLTSGIDQEFVKALPRLNQPTD